jgi:hypothetical protein
VKSYVRRARTLWRALGALRYVVCAVGGFLVGTAAIGAQSALLTVLNGVSMGIVFSSVAAMTQLRRRFLRQSLKLNRRVDEVGERSKYLEALFAQFLCSDMVELQDPAGHQHRFTRVGETPPRAH